MYKVYFNAKLLSNNSCTEHATMNGTVTVLDLYLYFYAQVELPIILAGCVERVFKVNCVRSFASSIRLINLIL